MTATSTPAQLRFRAMQERTQVAILSADALMRDGLSSLLAACAGVQVVAAGATARELLNGRVDMRDVVVLIDCAVPGLSKLSAVLAHVRAALPNAEVILLAFQADARFLASLAHNGCRACVLKEEGWRELDSAIRAIASGGSYLSPGAAEYLLAPGTQRVACEDGLAPLSLRESEVMQLIAGGQRTRDIARRLALSPKTVEKHRTNLMRKLGVRNVAGVAAYAAIQNVGIAT